MSNATTFIMLSLNSGEEQVSIIMHNIEMRKLRIKWIKWLNQAQATKEEKEKNRNRN